MIKSEKSMSQSVFCEVSVYKEKYLAIKLNMYIWEISN